MSRVLAVPLLAGASASALVLGFAAVASAAEPMGAVQGNLTDSLGGPLVGDETRITVSLYRDDELQNAAITQDLVLADHGGFQIPHVPAGRYAVKFDSHDRGHVGEWWGDTRRAAQRAFIEVADGGTVVLNAMLSETVALEGSITGRDVALSPTGEPVHVVASSGDAELDAWLPYRTTDARLPGDYAVWVVPGTYVLSFTDDTGAHRPQTIAGVVVTAPTTKDVVLAPARSSLSGTLSLRTSDGVVPLVWGYTSLYRWSSADAKWTVIDSCGRRYDGTFLLDCLSAGRYKLSVSHAGLTAFWGGGDLASAPEIVLSEDQTRTGIAIVIDAPASVRGVVAVRAGDGSIYPVKGEFTVWQETSAGVFTPIADVANEFGSAAAVAGNGEFSMQLPVGTYVFRFWADSPYEGATYLEGSRSFADAPRLTLGLGEQRDLGTILLPASSFDVARIAGADRFETAVAVSRHVIPDGTRAPVVYLTNAYNFPDALAAGPAATQAGGVILPVAPDSLPISIADELRRLRPLRVVIAGSESAISGAVRLAVSKIVPADTKIARLGGANRYETGDLIVRDAFAAHGSRYAIVATGATYPDALAAGPAAGHLGGPVVLVPGSGGLTDATKSTLAALGVKDVYIAGSDRAVSAAIESALRALLGSAHVTRLAGADRIFTAISINDEIFGSVDDAYIASANGFADAVAGGPLAAMQDAPLYLGGPQCLNFWTIESIRHRQIARLTILGGESVLGPSVANLTTCN